MASALNLGWYEHTAVAYFEFGKTPLTAVGGRISTSDIYVIYVDPTASDLASGFASGFKTEPENPAQTHNVLATVPRDTGYTPLKDVNVISQVNFADVANLTNTTAFTSTQAGISVNYPVAE